MIYSGTDKLLNELAEHQLCVSDDFFAHSLCAALLEDLDRFHAQSLFKKASIGRGNSLQANTEIRGDFTYWLNDEAASLAQRQFQSQMNEFQQILNQNFFIGLDHLEAHYAVYPQGSGYAKHIDQHRGTQERKVTFILYLNQEWKPGHGGELLIYDPRHPQQVVKTIEPIMGRLVLFRSEVFPHQVAIATAERKSLTGWFRSK